MNFLKNLFGGDGNNQSSDNRGLYFYVRPKMCQEVVQVRIDVQNELTALDEGGYFVRKVVSAHRCPFQSELHVTLDSNRNVKQIGVDKGEIVEREDYDAWLAQQTT